MNELNKYWNTRQKYNGYYADDIFKAIEGMNSDQIISFMQEHKVDPGIINYIDGRYGKQTFSKEVVGHDDERNRDLYKTKRTNNNPIFSEVLDKIGYFDKIKEAAEFSAPRERGEEGPGYGEIQRSDLAGLGYNNYEFSKNEHHAKKKAKKQRSGLKGLKNKGIDLAPLAIKAIVGAGLGYGALSAFGLAGTAAGGATGAETGANIGGSTAFSAANGAVSSSLTPSLMTTGELANIAPSIYSGAEVATTGATAGLLNEGINPSNYSLFEGGELADIAPNIYSNTVMPKNGLLDKAKEVGTKAARKIIPGVINNAITPTPTSSPVDPVVEEATNHYKSIMPTFVSYSLNDSYDRASPSTKGLKDV